MENLSNLQADATGAAIVERIMENVRRVIVGQERCASLCLTAMIAGGHVLLEDMPGTGKTLLAKSLARSVSEASLSRIQFTPDLLPSDVTGLYYYNQKAGEFMFRPGPVFCSILLADEINRATPRTQSALLECMGERQVTIEGNTHALEAPFFVIATQNPIETAGTFPLPEAQLDRFLMKLRMEKPTMEEEISIMNRFMKDEPLDLLAPVCTKDELLSLSAQAREVYVHPALMEYIAKIVQATREDASIVCGVSPRGTLALVRCVQAYALQNGRTFATPEDVKFLAIPVLAHRIITTRGYGVSDSSETFLKNILNRVPVPTEDFAK